MPDTRVKLKINRPRCPYCHDDIKPGGDNQACHECLAWHHSECWTQHGACVGCGNRWVKDPVSGSLSAPPLDMELEDPVEFNPNVDCSSLDDCFVHDRMNAKAKADLYAVHGPAADEMLAEMCKRGETRIQPVSLPT